MCAHQFRRQPVDPDTLQPKGPMVCETCGDEVPSRVPKGPGRCSACGRAAPQYKIHQVQAHMGTTPEGLPASTVTVSRCDACLPREPGTRTGPPPQPDAGSSVPIMRMNGR